MQPLTLVRVFAGGTFVYAGLDKLLDPTFLRGDGLGSLELQLRSATAGSPPLGFLLETLADHATAVGVGVGVAEVAIGVLTLLGVARLVAALGGMALTVGFLLTVGWGVSPWYLGNDLPYLVLWATLGLASWNEWRGPAPVPVEDGSLDERRRALLGGGAVVLTLAALGRGLFGSVGGSTVRSAMATGGATTTTTTTSSTATVAGATGSALATPVPSTGAPAPSPASATRVATPPEGQPVAPPTRSQTATSAPPATAGQTATTVPPTAGPPSTVPPTTAPPTTSVPGRPRTALASSSEVAAGAMTTFQHPQVGEGYLTRDGAGRAVGFNRRCTHAACSVVEDTGTGRSVCPCHGSAFRLADGAVLNGPASRPLGQIDVVEDAGTIYLA